MMVLSLPFQNKLIYFSKNNLWSMTSYSSQSKKEIIHQQILISLLNLLNRSSCMCTSKICFSFVLILNKYFFLSDIICRLNLFNNFCHETSINKSAQQSQFIIFRSSTLLHPSYVMVFFRPSETRRYRWGGQERCFFVSQHTTPWTQPVPDSSSLEDNLSVRKANKKLASAMSAVW